VTISSIRTLFIVTIIEPYPPLCGGLLRDWQIINMMKKFGSVGVFRRNSNGQLIPGVDLRYPYNLAPGTAIASAGRFGVCVANVQKTTLRKVVHPNRSPA
jgi:hypothetical protein